MSKEFSHRTRGRLYDENDEPYSVVSLPEGTSRRKGGRYKIILNGQKVRLSLLSVNMKRGYLAKFCITTDNGVTLAAWLPASSVLDGHRFYGENSARRREEKLSRIIQRIKQ